MGIVQQNNADAPLPTFNMGTLQQPMQQLMEPIYQQQQIQTTTQQLNISA